MPRLGSRVRIPSPAPDFLRRISGVGPWFRAYKVASRRNCKLLLCRRSTGWKSRKGGVEAVSGLLGRFHWRSDQRGPVFGDVDQHASTGEDGRHLEDWATIAHARIKVQRQPTHCDALCSLQRPRPKSPRSRRRERPGAIAGGSWRLTGWSWPGFRWRRARCH